MPKPERFLTPGRPSGSAMPLLWAHAEFLKLALAAKRGAPIERLLAVAERYRRAPRPRVVYWRDDSPCVHLAAGAQLSIEARAPFTLHYGHEAWQDAADVPSTPLAFGMHAVQLDPGSFAPGRALNLRAGSSDRVAASSITGRFKLHLRASSEEDTT